MKNKRFNIKPITLALLLAGIGMAQASYAVDLVAIDGQWSPDGGTTQIPMWGFAADTEQACDSLPTWTVGPQLGDSDLLAGDLTIKLRNCLSEPVSIVIPGQPATFTPVRVNGRVTAFTTEATANGGTASYTWTGVKPGTYLYQSGSHPAMQVQMGLYGALTVGTYADTSGDVTLLYSEIDPLLHSPPAAATPLGYHPRHYLVNGEDIQTSALTAGDTAQPTVLRMLNAGLDFHVPALNGGYMSLVAEDGNPYPFAKEQYSANLAAGKTIDALWQPATAGNHVIYDRRGNGMVASLTVDTGTPPDNTAPVAVADTYDVVESTSLTVAAPGVLGNDTDDGVDPLTVTITPVTTPSQGSLTLSSNGSFEYTSSIAAPGTDSFVYEVCDAESLCSEAMVDINIIVAPPNTAPVAVDDVIPAVQEDSATLFVDAPGVLGNDTDVDVADILTSVLDTNVSNGTLALSTDGSFTYTPDADFHGSDSFTYLANDGAADSNIATVSITVTPVNDAPAADPDNYVVDSGADLIVAAVDGVLANDSDIEGDSMTAVLVTGPADEDLVFNADGSFNYGSADGAARLSDSFSYQACDDGIPVECTTATVNITINQIVTNTPPVANPDTANVVRRTRTFINLTDNDTDVDNNIDPNGIVITAAPNQGGSVVVMPNGVEYRAPRNFATPDGAQEEFSYRVRDLNGATSNEVTVTVSVFRNADQFP